MGKAVSKQSYWPKWTNFHSSSKHRKNFKKDIDEAMFPNMDMTTLGYSEATHAEGFLCGGKFFENVADMKRYLNFKSFV